MDAPTLYPDRPDEIARIHEVWIERYVLPFAMCTAECLYGTVGMTHVILREGIPGAFAECGVAGGAHPAVMHYLMRFRGQYRKIYLFDSFQGVPMPTANDIPTKDRPGLDVRAMMFDGPEIVPKGKIVPSGRIEIAIEQTRTFMTQSGADMSSMCFVPGWFQDTLAKTVTGPLALLRLDGDVYDSIKVCIDDLYERVSSGGYVIVHDWHHSGVRAAVCDALGRDPPAKYLPERGATGTTAYWRKDYDD